WPSSIRRSSGIISRSRASWLTPLKSNPKGGRERSHCSSSSHTSCSRAGSATRSKWAGQSERPMVRARLVPCQRSTSNAKPPSSSSPSIASRYIGSACAACLIHQDLRQWLGTGCESTRESHLGERSPRSDRDRRDTRPSEKSRVWLSLGRSAPTLVATERSDLPSVLEGPAEDPEGDGVHDETEGDQGDDGERRVGARQHFAIGHQHTPERLHHI